IGCVDADIPRLYWGQTPFTKSKRGKLGPEPFSCGPSSAFWPRGNGRSPAFRKCPGKWGQSLSGDLRTGPLDLVKSSAPNRKRGLTHCCPTSGSEKGLVHFVGYNGSCNTTY